MFSWINQFIPKEEKTILLYCNMEFRDNIRYLCDYLIEKQYNKEYRIVLSAKGECPSYPSNVKCISNAKAIIGFFRAGHVIYSFGKLPIYPSKNQTVIQTWHGTPFKGFDETMKKSGGRKAFFTYALASSEFIRPIVARLFSCDETNVAICGQPRTDVMFETRDSYHLGVEGQRIILWTPTFRQSKVLGYNDTEGKGTLVPLFDKKELEELEKQLSDLDIALIIKLHPSQDLDDYQDVKFFHIRLLTHDQFQAENYDLYKLLPQTDALITDYSSIFYDYLLLDKPIAFTIDDYDDYLSHRGFAVDDPLSLMTGHKIKNHDDFLCFIRDIASGNDPYKKQREEINQLVNYYQDGKNRERALELAGIYHECRL